MIQTPIFKGLTEEELADMRSCQCMSEKKYARNDVIFHMGDKTQFLGIVMQGNVNIENIDLWGNKSILSNVSKGQVFGETYALTGEILMVDAVAAEASQILFLNVQKILRESYTGRSWHIKMLRNLLAISSRKNLVLSSRIFHTSSKKVRSRLQSYLSSYALKAGSREFDIPFDRQQLADYLNLDRSALSKELGRMRDEGIVDFRKNHFRLLD